MERTATRAAENAVARQDRLTLLLTRLHELSDDVLLSPQETGAVLDRSVFTLRHWRLKDPNHPLKWQRYGKAVRYRLGNVRAYARGE